MSDNIAIYVKLLIYVLIAVLIGRRIRKNNIGDIECPELKELMLHRKKETIG